jgi:hypothetical protein
MLDVQKVYHETHKHTRLKKMCTLQHFTIIARLQESVESYHLKVLICLNKEVTFVALVALVTVVALVAIDVKDR